MMSIGSLFAPRPKTLTTSDAATYKQKDFISKLFLECEAQHLRNFPASTKAAASALIDELLKCPCFDGRDHDDASDLPEVVSLWEEIRDLLEQRWSKQQRES